MISQTICFGLVLCDLDHWPPKLIVSYALALWTSCANFHQNRSPCFQNVAFKSSVTVRQMDARTNGQRLLLPVKTGEGIQICWTWNGNWLQSRTGKQVARTVSVSSTRNLSNSVTDAPYVLPVLCYIQDLSIITSAWLLSLVSMACWLWLTTHIYNWGANCSSQCVLFCHALACFQFKDVNQPCQYCDETYIGETGKKFGGSQITGTQDWSGIQNWMHIY